MVRTFLGVIAGLVTWAVVATILDIGVRYGIPGYREAEPTLLFTLPMKIARLSLAVIASLGAGFVTRLIAPASRMAPWIVGLVMLALFLPSHIQIGARLPLWYHLFFLLTLVPLVVLGAQLRLPGRRP
ncbi:hypothetical protein [Sphingomonas sp. MMS24-J13]|uniref:hypothetical protein n=1 Tax=Sphingomonas sp. MMS24-J13 TaxID=3238686 RepID=UPI00384D9863